MTDDKNLHDDLILYSCHYCNQWFSAVALLWLHIQSAHPAQVIADAIGEDGLQDRPQATGVANGETQTLTPMAKCNYCDGSGYRTTEHLYGGTTITRCPKCNPTRERAIYLSNVEAEMVRLRAQLAAAAQLALRWESVWIDLGTESLSASDELRVQRLRTETEQFADRAAARQEGHDGR